MNRIQVVIVLLALVSACSPKVDTGGYMKETDIKGQITEGKTTKQEVQEKFGSPSAQSSFGNETWYYITDRKETMAFFAPEVVEQDVTRVEFDAAGTVISVQAFNKNDSKEFSLAKRTTPTEGHQLGFVEQLLGNVGRFNKPGMDSNTGGFGSRGSHGY